MGVAGRHEVGLVGDLGAVGVFADYAPEKIHALGEGRLLAADDLFVQFELVLEVR